MIPTEFPRPKGSLQLAHDRRISDATQNSRDQVGKHYSADKIQLNGEVNVLFAVLTFPTKLAKGMSLLQS